jgi:hypothetical protein
MSLIASRFLLTSTARRNWIPVTRSVVFRFSSASAATNPTPVESKSNDPEWIKIAVQQILQHCDNNKGITGGVVRSANTIDGDATNLKRKAAVSDEDLEKALQSYKVSFSTTPYVQKLFQ